MSDSSIKVIKACQSLKNELREIGTIGLVLTDADQTILPFTLYRGKRTHIEKIADQINKSYSYRLYDGASVLIRKLMEMLLVLVYKQIGQEEEIKNAASYKPLSDIINHAMNNRTLDLSRTAKSSLNSCKARGDQSAHNPFYVCTKVDIDAIKYEFRVAFEELMHKAGIS